MAGSLVQMQIAVQGDHNVIFVLHVKVLLALQVWRMPDLVLVTTLRGHKRGVWAAQFSPVDQAVATASGLPLLGFACCVCVMHAMQRMSGMKNHIVIHAVSCTVQ